MECLGSACFGVECFELTNQHVKFPVFPDSLKLASRAGRRESRDAVKTGCGRIGRSLNESPRTENLSSRFVNYELRALREAAGATPRIPQPPPDFHHSLILHARTDSTTAARDLSQHMRQTALKLAILSGYDGADRFGMCCASCRAASLAV